MPKEPSKRRPNFSSGEIEMLESQAVQRKIILFGKFSNTITKDLKSKEWQKVAEAVNRVAPNQRTADEVRKKWENVKSIGKEQLASKYKKCEMTRTGGGGPSVELPTPREERLISVIGERSIVGIEAGIDTSALEMIAHTPTSMVMDGDDSNVSIDHNETNVGVLKGSASEEAKQTDKFGRQLKSPDKKSISEKLLDAQNKLCGIMERTNELLEISIASQQQYSSEFLTDFKTLIQIVGGQANQTYVQVTDELD